jgi:hypothetical protein
VGRVNGPAHPGFVHTARYGRGVYSVTLFCSDPACDAVFEAEGSLEAVEAALCSFCGCVLSELACMPCESEATAASGQLEDLELWVIHEPAGRRLRRRRPQRRLRKAA